MTLDRSAQWQAANHHYLMAEIGLVRQVLEARGTKSIEYIDRFQIFEILMGASHLFKNMSLRWLG